MSIQKALVLDHFFINASADDFAALLKLKDFIPNGIRHDVVKAQNDEWEGIYIRSRAGSYFEILRDRRPNALGLAFQTVDPMAVDASTIMTQLPLEWIIFERLRPDGSRWFDSISTGPTDVSSLFVAWIMKYYVRNIAVTSGPLPRTCDRFPAIELSLGRAHVDQIRTSSEWFPGLREIGEDSIHFQVPDRDGWPFDVRIDLVDGDQRFEFKKLVIDLYDTSALPRELEMQLGSFLLRRDGDSLILTR